MEQNHAIQIEITNEGFSEVLSQLREIPAQIESVNNSISGLTDSFSQLNDSMNKTDWISNSIGIAGLLINAGSLVVGIISLVKQFSDAKKATEELSVTQKEFETTSTGATTQINNYILAIQDNSVSIEKNTGILIENIEILQEKANETAAASDADDKLTQNEEELSVVVQDVNEQLDAKSQTIGETLPQIDNLSQGLENVAEESQVVAEQGANVVQAIADIGTVSEQVSGDSEVLASKLDDVSDSIEQAGQSGNNMAGTFEILISNIGDAGRSVSDMVGSVKNMMTAITSTDGSAKSFVSSIKTIGSSAIGAGKSAFDLVGSLKTMAPTMMNAGGAVGALGKAFSSLSSGGIGIAIAAVTALIGIIAFFVNKKAKEFQERLENIGEGASTFTQGISSAESYLSSFNNALSVSAEQQMAWQDDMSAATSGIGSAMQEIANQTTNVTAQQIEDMKGYLDEVQRINDEQLQAEKDKADAVMAIAMYEADNKNMSAEEYAANAQRWIATAQEQAQAQIDIADDQATQELILLEQAYNSKDGLIANASEEERAALEAEFEQKKNDIMARRDEEISLANETVSGVADAYATGYAELTGLDLELTPGMDLKDVTEGMSEEQQAQLGVYMAMTTTADMYGESLSEANRDMANSILDGMDDLPKNARETMENAMAPMLEEMERMEPRLFAKAEGTANGIIARLKKAFDSHSPSRKTRAIFRDVMEGSILGLEDEENELMRLASRIGEGTLDSLEGAISGMQSVVTMPFAAMAAYHAVPAGGTTVVNNTTELNQTVNTHDSLSPSELTREAEDFLRRSNWRLP